MEKTKLGETKFVVKPNSNLKEVEFYKEPEPGCPGFIKNPSKCQPKGLPEWGVK